jgi:hypothetical protein
MTRQKNLPSNHTNIQTEPRVVRKLPAALGLFVAMGGAFGLTGCSNDGQATEPTDVPASVATVDTSSTQSETAESTDNTPSTPAETNAGSKTYTVDGQIVPAENVTPNVVSDTVVLDVAVIDKSVWFTDESFTTIRSLLKKYNDAHGTTGNIGLDAMAQGEFNKFPILSKVDNCAGASDADPLAPGYQFSLANSSYDGCASDATILMLDIVKSMDNRV